MQDYGENTRHWCARASATIQADDGSSLTRQAYFYIPGVPANLELPHTESRDLALDQCTLGLIWVETNREFDASDQLVDDIVARLQAGKEVTPDSGNHPFFGSAYWKKRIQWKTGDQFIVVAHDASRSRPWRVIVASSLPNSDFLVHLHQERWPPARELTDFRQAVELAAKHPDISAEVLRTHSSVVNTECWVDPKQQRAIAGLLGRWVGGETSLPKSQRAAVHYAADRLLALLGGSRG